MALVLALQIIEISSLLLLLLRLLYMFVRKGWWTPISIQKMMKSQGIKGLPYEFPHGNTRVIAAMRSQSMNHPMDIMSHDIFPPIQPHVYSWIKTYGEIFTMHKLCSFQRFIYVFEMFSTVEFYKLAWVGCTAFRY
ncbi:hypothetical protein HanPI659440_Chr16g0655091 [Helianthus annuus]|nr:hypothetical protein HanPI659440_Chr16g0655091 [Helianthus annuus]